MIRLLKRSSFLLLATALVFSLSACDSGGSNEDDDEPDVEEGRTEVSIDGDASGSFDGYAFFVEDTYEDTDSTSRPVFGIMLSEMDELPDPEEDGEEFFPEGEFIVMVRESGRPDVGQHSFTEFDVEGDDDELNSEDFIAVAWSMMDDANSFASNLYFSDGGTLNITSSSDDRVAGNFEINAVGFSFSMDGDDFDEEETNITIEGAFDAKSANTFYEYWSD